MDERQKLVFHNKDGEDVVKINVDLEDGEKWNRKATQFQNQERKAAVSDKGVYLNCSEPWI